MRRFKTALMLSCFLCQSVLKVLPPTPPQPPQPPPCPAVVMRQEGPVRLQDIARRLQVPAEPILVKVRAQGQRPAHVLSTGHRFPTLIEPSSHCLLTTVIHDARIVPSPSLCRMTLTVTLPLGKAGLPMSMPRTLHLSWQAQAIHTAMQGPKCHAVALQENPVALQVWHLGQGFPSGAPLTHLHGWAQTTV